MKKVIIALMLILALALGGTLDGNTSTEPLEPHPDKIEHSHHLYITSFYDSDFGSLVRWTKGLKKGDELRLTIMSGGGPVVPLIAMVNYVETLKARGIKIVTEVAGMSMSAAAILWMLGDERIVHPHDYMMFHGAIVPNPYTGKAMTREEMGKINAWVLDWADHLMRQLLLDILRDTELVNELMADKGNLDENTNMHFYIGSDIYKMGIATKLEGR